MFIRGSGFSLRLDRCEVSLPGMRGNHLKGASYHSTLTLLEEGKEVRRGSVAGSLTLKYKSIRIAQPLPPERDNFIALLVASPQRANGAHRMYRLKRYETFKVPETGHTVLVKNILSSSHLFPL